MRSQTGWTLRQTGAKDTLLPQPTSLRELVCGGVIRLACLATAPGTASLREPGPGLLAVLRPRSAGQG